MSDFFIGSETNSATETKSSASAGTVSDFKPLQETTRPVSPPESISAENRDASRTLSPPESEKPPGESGITAKILSLFGSKPIPQAILPDDKSVRYDAATGKWIIEGGDEDETGTEPKRESHSAPPPPPSRSSPPVVGLVKPGNVLGAAAKKRVSSRYALDPRTS